MLFNSNCREVDSPLGMEDHGLVKYMPQIYDLQKVIGDNATFYVMNEMI